MATRIDYYKDLDLRYPEMGVVLEDNIWNFGEAKQKAKVNIPILLPLEEKSEITSNKSIKSKSNIHNAEKGYESVNYVELYLPDWVYTYPTEGSVANSNVSIKGAKAGDKRLTDSNGKTKTGLTRIVKKNTRVIVIFIGGESTPDKIKVIAKYDDYEEEKIMNGGNTGGISTTTYQSALR